MPCFARLRVTLPGALVLLALASPVAAQSGASSTPNARALRVEDFYRLKSVGAPALSPATFFRHPSCALSPHPPFYSCAVPRTRRPPRFRSFSTP